MVDSSSTNSFRVLCTLIFKSTFMLSIPSNSYSQPFAFLSTHKANDSLQPLPVPTESHSHWHPIDVLASALQIRMKVNAIFIYSGERVWKRDIGNFLEKITVILHSTCPRSMVCLYDIRVDSIYMECVCTKWDTFEQKRKNISFKHIYLYILYGYFGKIILPKAI